MRPLARFAAIGYVAVGLYATRVALRDDVRARFGGIAFPGTAAQQCTFFGTGLSAPLVLLAAWSVAIAHDDRITVRTLAAATFLGSLGEPVTWQRRYSRIVGASLAMSAVVVLATPPTPTTVGDTAISP